MSLSNINISKNKKLSLNSLKTANNNNRTLDTENPTVNKPPTPEELIYKDLKANYPILERLAKEWKLVYSITGKTLEPQEVESKKEEVDLSKLRDLINKTIEGENQYSKEEIVCRLMNYTKVTSERAETGFKLFLKSNLIDKTLGESYYLVDSTPF